MPSFFDSFTDRLRTLKTRGLRRSSSTRRSVNKNTSTLPRGAEALANAPPESPINAMPQPQFPNDQDNSLESKYSTLPAKRNVHTLLRSNTLVSSTSIDPSRNFWDIRGYKNTLNRCDDGYELGTRLMNCLLDRARLEEDYSKSLRMWNKKWSDYLNGSQIEYGTGKSAWLAMLQTGEDVASIHTELSEKLQKTPVCNIKCWLKDKYQKHVISFKQYKEFEADFETAQKSWQKTFDKMKQRKKEYYICVKKERQALTNSEMIRANIDKTEEQKRKAVQEHELAKLEADRAKKAYVDEIQKLELYEPTYRKEMKHVFEKTDSFEENRRKKFEDVFLESHKLFEEQVNHSLYKSVFENYMAFIEQINHKDDIKWWSDTYGVGMPLVMPVFDEFFG
jgi:hypothetical protein